MREEMTAAVYSLAPSTTRPGPGGRRTRRSTESATSSVSPFLLTGLPSIAFSAHAADLCFDSHICSVGSTLPTWRGGDDDWASRCRSEQVAGFPAHLVSTRCSRVPAAAALACYLCSSTPPAMAPRPPSVQLRFEEEGGAVLPAAPRHEDLCCCSSTPGRRIDWVVVLHWCGASDRRQQPLIRLRGSQRPAAAGLHQGLGKAHDWPHERGIRRRSS